MVALLCNDSACFIPLVLDISGQSGQVSGTQISVLDELDTSLCLCDRIVERCELSRMAH